MTRERKTDEGGNFEKAAAYFVRACRKLQGMTQAEYARLFGMGQESWHKLETGKNRMKWGVAKKFSLLAGLDTPLAFIKIASKIERDARSARGLYSADFSEAAEDALLQAFPSRPSASPTGTAGRLIRYPAAPRLIAGAGAAGRTDPTTGAPKGAGPGARGPFIFCTEQALSVPELATWMRSIAARKPRSGPGCSSRGTGRPSPPRWRRGRAGRSSAT